MHVMFYTITIIVSYDNSQCEITHRSKYNHVWQLWPTSYNRFLRQLQHKCVITLYCR